jgi:hypothetical protein
MNRLALWLGLLAFPALALEPAHPTTPATPMPPAAPTGEAAASGDIELPPQRLLVKFSAEGRIEDIQYQSEMLPLIRDLVRNAVREWRFEPVLRDGQPVPSAAVLVLKLQALANPEAQDYRIRVKSISTSSWVDQRFLPSPRYPSSMARSRRSASVCVEVRIARDGRVAPTGVVYADGVLKDKHDVFALAALEAVPQWSVTPIIIDGVNYSTETVRGVPIVFHMPSSGKPPPSPADACPKNDAWNPRGPRVNPDPAGTLL